MTTYRVLLPHPLEPRLLMMQAHGEWRLPEWEDATEHLWQVTDHVNRAVSARFGMETSVLRCVRKYVDPQTARETRIYELDNHSAPHDVVPATTWIGQSELHATRKVDPETRELIANWFSRERGEIASRGAPWTQRGWYVEALAWTTAHLAKIGVMSLGAPEQLRAWERSFLMRVHTDAGLFYFKASPHMFKHEPALVQWLARRVPDNMPQQVAVDVERGWLLQREVDGSALPLNEVREEEEWYRAARRLAEIQVMCAQQTHELQAIGVPHRGLELLARRIPRLCTDASVMLHGESCGLTRAEIERVGSLAPKLLTMCEELATFAIPDSIEHGDLVPANILSTLNGPIYLDWSDGSLSHPFFSLSPIMSAAEGLLPASSQESRRRMRDNYLAPWTVVTSHEQLVRAFEIARVLAPVHHAATVHAELLPAAGHRWELECAVPSLLRTALRLMLDNDSPLLTHS